MEENRRNAAYLIIHRNRTAMRKSESEHFSHVIIREREKKMGITGVDKAVSCMRHRANPRNGYGLRFTIADLLFLFTFGFVRIP